MNAPTAENPLELPCQACGGDGGHEAGCADCRGRGVVEIVGCPFRQVTPDVWTAIEGWRREKKGSWPVAGGWLEQSAIFMESLDCIEREDSRYGKEV